MTFGEAMQYASSYQLDLYCDTCYGVGNTSPWTYVGESFADCARQAKRDGWTIRTKPRTARCRGCKKRKAARPLSPEGNADAE